MKECFRYKRTNKYQSFHLPRLLPTKVKRMNDTLWSRSLKEKPEATIFL